MAHNLILTGGVFHPFASAAPELAAQLDAHGIRSTITEDIEAGLAELAYRQPELLTVYTLRWSMRQHDKYAPHRDQWALTLSEAGRVAITAHLDRGGGLLALHTAVICFDSWPEWGRLLGGAWLWGTSGHPPYGRAAVRIDERDHPIVSGIPNFALEDEIYGNLMIEPDVVPLMSANADTGADGWQPVLWERSVGNGRVVYDALGHEASSLRHSVHSRVLARCALWALGRGRAELEAV